MTGANSLFYAIHIQAPSTRWLYCKILTAHCMMWVLSFHDTKIEVRHGLGEMANVIAHSTKKIASKTHRGWDWSDLWGTD